MKPTVTLSFYGIQGIQTISSLPCTNFLTYLYSHDCFCNEIAVNYQHLMNVFLLRFADSPKRSVFVQLLSLNRGIRGFQPISVSEQEIEGKA